MKITCQACQSKYTIADEKIQGKVAKIRCRKCGATVLVDGSGAAANGSAATSMVPTSVAPPPASPPAGDTWLVNVADGDQRSMSVAELSEAARNGTVSSETYVWKEGMAEWSPLGQVPELAATLSAETNAAQPAPHPVSQPTPGPAASRFSPAAAAGGGAAVAARREPARARGGGATDLFGTAPVEEEVATSVPSHVLEARARSGAGAAAGSDGLAAATEPSAGGNPTGARDEHSVLFSLSALTARTGDGSSGGRGSGPVTEDSGLIDLNALAKAQAALGGEQAKPAAPVAAAPMLFPAALGTVEVAAPVALGGGAPAKRSSTPMIVGIGGVAVAIAAVIFAISSSHKAEEAAAAAAASASAAALAAAAAAAPPPVASAPAEPVASASAAPAESAPVPEKPTKVTHRRSSSHTARPTAAGGGGGVALPAPPPRPKASPCGCAPADLQCQIRCSAMGH